eukprot:3182700-Rhodomonas_salina.3
MGGRAVRSSSCSSPNPLSVPDIATTITLCQGARAWHTDERVAVPDGRARLMLAQKGLLSPLITPRAESAPSTPWHATSHTTQQYRVRFVNARYRTSHSARIGR